MKGEECSLVSSLIAHSRDQGQDLGGVVPDTVHICPYPPAYCPYPPAYCPYPVFEK